ncbi:LADA_0C01310g1_1 [Lachancea dasiensis]|uniref:21S rRNA pseudouridine(2819) synthase n=1 Tax=Lachancea dasiensis TaxID=1072105 RepID=A0A1G4IY20_9SACH|nr:LADA_0C01310g1_1 [Lachancea dasiensis]
MSPKVPVRIIYNCKCYLVVNKPIGVFSQMPDLAKWASNNDGNPPPVLLDLVRTEANNKGQSAEEWRTVHRLDTNVTGGVLIAKTKSAAASFSKNLRKGGNAGNKLIRKYIALVDGETNHIPDQGHLEYDGMKSWFRKIDSGALALQLCTGRKHQIRLQLSKIGIPIKNDLKYGGAPINGAGRQIGLHSAMIHTQVGLQRRKHLIAINSGQESLWSEYIDDCGNFKPAVERILLEDWVFD